MQDGTKKTKKKEREAKGPGTMTKRKLGPPSIASSDSGDHVPGEGMTPFDVFERCIERAQNLTKIHKQAHGARSRPQSHLADLHRAAIVMSISALDAFVRTFVISSIRKLLARQDAILPEDLKTHICRFLKEDQLLEAARRVDLLDRVEKAFRGHFEKKSFQGTKAISDGFRLIGYENIFHTVAMESQSNEDNLTESLDKFTDRRHVIAHRGDYDMTVNPPKENKALKKDAKECIRLVRLIAKHINELRIPK